MSFSSQVKRATILAEQDAEKVVRGTILGILSRTINRTPVRTGRLQDNWQTSIGKPITSEKRQADALSQGSAVLNSFKIGDTIFFTNNVPYAGIVEFGDADRDRPPVGMLRRSVNEVR